MWSKWIMRVALVTITAIVAACGGGGGGGATVNPSAPAGPSSPVGLDRFLLFPNPLVDAAGTFETNTAAYTAAYHAALDPTNAKDTLAKWKTANGFDSGTGTQLSVVFGDVRDLGYGRRLTVRRNPNGTVAAFVENYLVNAGTNYTYSSVNVEAAVAAAKQYHIGTNAIEYTPGPNGGVSFNQFYTFAPDGTRANTVDLDGRGQKAMPGPCISCHGGRADPLTPPNAVGNRLFALVQNALSQHRGDVQARMHPIEVSALDFVSTPGFTRGDQEAAIKSINQMILCTYPIPAATAFPEDACRRVATANEWQGSAAADQLKAAYGGNGLPGALYTDNFVPPTWAAAGQSSLYTGVVAPACRACHALRGTGNQSDVDFETFAGFATYSDRIRAHIFDRGNMPLARLVFQNFHASNMPATLAAFLQSQGFPTPVGPTAPGRPIADPGPDRVIPQGNVTLNGTMSLYSTTYQWSMVSGPAGATLTGATSAQPVFNAIADGAYVVQLVTSSGSASSTAVQQRLTVNNGKFGVAYPLPQNIRFADIKTALQSAGAGCTTCHTQAGIAPIAYTNYDRNADGVTNATDDTWFYTEIRGRINFTDFVASPLLRKPSGNHHNGGLRTGFDTSLAPGQTGRDSYDMFVNWILNGAPQ